MTAPKTKMQQGRLLIPWLVALLGVVGSLGAYLGLHLAEEAHIDTEFRRRSQAMAYLVEQTLHNREDALLSMRQLFHHSANVTRNEFTMAASDLIEHYPGLNALLWAVRVPPTQREKFEAEISATTQSNYKIYGAQETALTATEDSFPIYSIAPRGFLNLEGYDLATSPVWSDFLQAARSGRTYASGQPAFIKREPADTGYLLELPVYRDSVPRSEQERTSGLLRGFILGIIEPAPLLDIAAARMPNHGLDLILVERTTPTSTRTLHFVRFSKTPDTKEIPTVETFARGQHRNIDLYLAGRNWELWCRPSIAWLGGQRTYHEHITAFLGIIFFILLALYLRFLFRQATAVEETVARRTLELTKAQQELREDIQKRVQTEQALKASEERYRMLVSQSSDSIGRIEFGPPISTALNLEDQIKLVVTTGHIAECNEITAQMYGYKDAASIIGTSCEHFAPCSRPRYETVFHAFIQNGYHLIEYEACDNLPAGKSRVFIHNLIGVIENKQLVSIWITERELTQQRQIEQEKQSFQRRLAETQRLESLGVLAGGIAHDFNNLLTCILGNASLGRAEIPSESPLNTQFEQIEIASRSAASLCQQMLAYAGKGRFIIKPHNLSQIVSDTSHLLRISISKNTELRFQLAENLPQVMADATQLKQIIMNLVINASEAISPHSGLIFLTTGLIQADETTFSGCAYRPPTLAPAYVFLEVRDNGSGMSTDMLGRIFEPFYTTKFAGRGLGLAAALGIVRSHNGALRVESQLGTGSTFTLYLPITESPPREEPVNTASNSPWNAEGTMLIIDDEESVRGIAERIARSLGFSVLTAQNGLAGLELFKLYAKSIAVVLLDLSMPGLSGEETLLRLRELSPTLNIVVMSGYNQPTLPIASGSKPPGFLSKPFNIAQFQFAVRQATKRA